MVSPWHHYGVIAMLPPYLDRVSPACMAVVMGIVGYMNNPRTEIPRSPRGF